MTTTPTEARVSRSTTKDGWRALLSPLVMALGALLALQLLTALALGLGGSGMVPAGSSGPLLAFDPEQVTGIRVQTSDGETVAVAKTESGWVVPSLADLPAAEHKVTALLSKLAGLEKGLPVATSEEALERFKLADQGFERKVALEGGDNPPAALYLGDSPGFRRLFVRADGEGAVYDVELGLFDVPEKGSDWSDRTLLHLKTDDIQQLTFAGTTLKREDNAWRVADLAEEQEQDEQAIADAVRTISTIDFLGVLGEAEEPSIDEETSPVRIEATLASGETLSYEISKLAKSEDYLLEASNRPQRFKLAAYAAEALTGMSGENLIKEVEETAETPPAEPASAATASDPAPKPAARTPTAEPSQAQDEDESGSEGAQVPEPAAAPAEPQGSEEPSDQ